MYNRRDLIGHWVDKDKPILQPCRHACCRGYRPHPSNWPLVPASYALRRATDEQLAGHFRKTGAEDSPQARRGELQIIHELERRDRVAAKQREKEHIKQARAANRAGKRIDDAIEVERIRVASESATSGFMVNAKGRARGINPDEILTGREAVFRRYASDEAKEYFAVNPRPTAAYFRGRDTRVHDRATEPKRRKRGVVGRPTGRRTLDQLTRHRAATGR